MKNHLRNYPLNRERVTDFRCRAGLSEACGEWTPLLLQTCGPTLHTRVGRPCPEPQTTNSANVATSPLCMRARTQFEHRYCMNSAGSGDALWENPESLHILVHQSFPTFPSFEHSDMPHKQGLALMKQARGPHYLPQGLECLIPKGSVGVSSAAPFRPTSLW